MAAAQRKGRPIPAHVEAMIAALPDSGTVTVACKLPNGLILRLFEMQRTEELVMGGGVREVDKAFLTDHEPVVLKGCAAPFGSPIVTIGGYALTQNVDAQYFAEWLRQNSDSDIVRNRLVFAQATRDHVEGMAAEQEEVKSGLHPLTKSEDGGDERDPNRRKVKTADLSKDD
jgi:hypothetical protein